MQACETGGFLFHLEASSPDNARIVFAGAGIETVAGLTAAEACRDVRLFARRIHADDSRAVVQGLKASAKSLRVWQQAFRLQRPDGQIRFVSVRAEPVNGADRTICWYGMLNDLTVPEQIPQNIADTGPTLNACPEFQKRINHELRKPLNGMLGFVQLMAGDRVNPLAITQRERLNHIETAALRLLDMTDNMLAPAPLPSNGNWIERDEVDLISVVRECVALAQPMAHDKAIKLTLSAPARPATVMANGQALAQIVGHLVSHALASSDPAAPVFVAIQEIAGRWCVSMLCQGHGLSDNRIKTLFQPFNQQQPDRGGAPASDQRLSLSQALAEAMGGRITVRSVTGRGSCFRLHLDKAGSPAYSGHEPTRPSPMTARGCLPPPMPATARATTADGEAPEKQGALIMYAEDDRLNAVLVSDALRRRKNYRVLHVENGEIAWAHIQNEKPDLLLADINMPDLDGYGLIKRIRATPRFADMPCVAISANARPEEIQAGLQAGFDAYWSKPVNLTNLTAQIGRLLSKVPLLPVEEKEKV